VACPFFFPVERFEDGAWLKPPRLPLGDPCRGVCYAPGDPATPSTDELRTLCNLGYARGTCTRFPADAEADAIRFSITKDRDETVDLIYIFEKDYGPLRHGTLRYQTAESRLCDAPANPILCAQAERFLESYIRRRTHS
jgi:hypothetical protein